MMSWFVVCPRAGDNSRLVFAQKQQYFFGVKLLSGKVTRPFSFIILKTRESQKAQLQLNAFYFINQHYYLLLLTLIPPLSNTFCLRDISCSLYYLILSEVPRTRLVKCFYPGLWVRKMRLQGTQGLGEGHRLVEWRKVFFPLLYSDTQKASGYCDSQQLYNMFLPRNNKPFNQLKLPERLPGQ